MKIEITKDKMYLMLGIIAILIAGLVYYQFFMPNNNIANYENIYSVTMANIENQEIDYIIYEEYEETITYETEITVFISGEVNEIGVFTLPSNSRMIDVLDKAGGPTSYADLNRVNLASFLIDTQHIVIPSIYDEIIYESLVNSNVQESSGLVNINSASLQELQTLPGIGPVLAGNIINHRNENGPFSSIAEIQNVNRIGSGIFSNIAPLITVD